MYCVLSTRGQWRTHTTGLSGEAGYKLTAEEIVDDRICCTVGVYEPVWESEPCIHCLPVISVLESPKDSAGKTWYHNVIHSFLHAFNAIL